VAPSPVPGRAPWPLEGFLAQRRGGEGNVILPQGYLPGLGFSTEALGSEALAQ